MKRRLGVCCILSSRSAMAYAGGSIDAIINTHLMTLHRTQMSDTGQVVYGFDDAQSLLDVNVGSLLAHSTDPEQSLTLYMRDLQLATHQQSQNQQLLRSRRDDALKRRAGCLQQKSSSDREFFLGVRLGVSDAILAQITQTSAKAGACAEQARVKARAYTIMLEQTAQYANQLQRRLQIIRSNETFLLQHRDLIDTDPTTIIQVNRLIQQIN